MLINWLKRLETVGSSSENTKAGYKVILTNRIAIISFLLAFPYIFVFGYFKLVVATLAVFPTLLICISILILNKYRRNRMASALTVFGITAVVLFYSLHLGFNSGAHLIFFPLVAWPFILFQNNERLLKYSGFLFLIFCVLVNHYFRIFYMASDELLLSYEVAKIIYFIATMTTVSFITATIYFFYKSERKIRRKLEKSNNRLTLNYLRVRQMITKIRQQQAMEADLEKGKKLQNSVLPQQAPKLENVIITHAFEPAKTLSGDYFDYFLNKVTALILPKPKNNEDDDNYDDDDEDNVIYKQVGIVVADVVGKGVAASLEMFSVKTVFKLLHDHWFEPQALVTRMNQISTDSHLFSKYVPLIYVTLTQVEAHQYLLKYVNAGHEPAIIVRATGAVEILDQGGAPVGMDADEKYIQNAIALYPGDVTFVITDGCTDVKSPTGEVIGHEELIPILIEASKKKDADMAKYVRNRLRDFQGNAAQADDMTIVVIQIL